MTSRLTMKCKIQLGQLHYLYICEKKCCEEQTTQIPAYINQPWLDFHGNYAKVDKVIHQYSHLVDVMSKAKFVVFIKSVITW